MPRPTAPGGSRRGRDALWVLGCVLAAISIAAPWQALIAGGVPTERAGGMAAWSGVWRFWATILALEGPGAGLHSGLLAQPWGVELMLGEHGTLYARLLAPVHALLGAPRSFCLAWCLSVGVSAGATYGLLRSFGRARWVSLVVAVVWAATPAFSLRGFDGPGALLPPTAPLAALGLLRALTSGDARPFRALAGGLLAGAALIASLQIGPLSATTTLFAVVLTALHLSAVRSAGPGLVGVVAVGLVGASMYLGAREAQDALPVLDGRLLAAPVGYDAPLESGSERAPIALVGRPPLWPGEAPNRGWMPALGLILAAVGGVRRGARLSTGAALLGSGLLGWGLLGWGRGAESLAPAIAAAVGGWVLALAARALERIRPHALAGLAAGLLVSEVLTPGAGVAPMPALEVARSVGASPLKGALLDVPVRRAPGPHLARQWTHGRPTPAFHEPAPPPQPDQALAALAPELARLLGPGPAGAGRGADGLDEGAAEPLESLAERLAAELDWLALDHLLVEPGQLDPTSERLLDRIPGWERAPDPRAPDEPRWWYRATELWSAPER